MAKTHTILAIISVCIFGLWVIEADTSYLHNILSHPLIQCRLKGGTCQNIDTCSTTTNIYKDICKTYNYHDVCCISRTTVCQKFSGFCTNNSNTCLNEAALLFRGGYGHTYKPVVFSWLHCNATHRCCHPINVKKSYGHGHGHGHLQDEGQYQGKYIDYGPPPATYGHYIGGHHGGGGHGHGGGFGKKK